LGHFFSIFLNYEFLVIGICECCVGELKDRPEEGEKWRSCWDSCIVTGLTDSLKCLTKFLGAVTDRVELVFAFNRVGLHGPAELGALNRVS
jgi:hypothetical protein